MWTGLAALVGPETVDGHLRYLDESAQCFRAGELCLLRTTFHPPAAHSR